MPTFIPNTFTKVEWASAEEEKQASIFSELNIIYLISLRGIIAQEKLSLNYTVDAPMKFLQNEAFLTGQLELLNKLIGD